jgi:hypothetical protein
MYTTIVFSSGFSLCVHCVDIGHQLYLVTLNLSSSCVTPLNRRILRPIIIITRRINIYLPLLTCIQRQADSYLKLTSVDCTLL